MKTVFWKKLNQSQKLMTLALLAVLGLQTSLFQSGRLNVTEYSLESPITTINLCPTEKVTLNDGLKGDDKGTWAFRLCQTANSNVVEVTAQNTEAGCPKCYEDAGLNTGKVYRYQFKLEGDALKSNKQAVLEAAAEQIMTTEINAKLGGKTTDTLVRNCEDTDGVDRVICQFRQTYKNCEKRTRNSNYSSYSDTCQERAVSALQAKAKRLCKNVRSDRALDDARAIDAVLEEYSESSDCDFDAIEEARESYIAAAEETKEARKAVADLDKELRMALRTDGFIPPYLADARQMMLEDIRENIAPMLYDASATARETGYKDNNLNRAQADYQKIYATISGRQGSNTMNGSLGNDFLGDDLNDFSGTMLNRQNLRSRGGPVMGGRGGNFATTPMDNNFMFPDGRYNPVGVNSGFPMQNNRLFMNNPMGNYGLGPGFMNNRPPMMNQTMNMQPPMMMNRRPTNGFN